MPPTVYRRSAYKLCNDPGHRGSRWMLRVYFYVLKRDEDGEPRTWAATCMTCMNRYAKRYQQRRGTAATEEEEFRFRGRRPELRPPEPEPQRRGQNQAVTEGRVPAPPFRSWLSQKVVEIGIANVASAVGVSQRRVYALLQTYYVKDGVQYPIRHVELATVSEYMFAFHEYTSDLYGDV